MKRILTLLLAAIMVLGLAACGTKTPAETKPTETQPVTTEATTEASTEAATEPQFRTVTDLQGRTVEVPYHVETVAALGSAARMLTYAGCADKIVGCSDLEKEGNPSMPFAYVSHDILGNAASISSGGSGDTIYAEELVVLSPDVIFYFGADKDTLDQTQEQMNIPVVGLYASNFYDADFRQTLALIGEIMENEEHVTKVIESLDTWIADLTERTKDIPEESKPTVYTGALGFRGSHGFEGTSANFPPFKAVNAKNVADETGETGTFLVDLEKVAVWDPDYIFVNPNSMYLVNENYAVNASFYDNLTAVKEGKVFSLVSYNYFWTNQELAIVDAYFVGSTIYPEQFADVDFEAKAEEIFNVMLGQDYLEILENSGNGFGPITIGE